MRGKQRGSRFFIYYIFEDQAAEAEKATRRSRRLLRTVAWAAAGPVVLAALVVLWGMFV